MVVYVEKAVLDDAICTGNPVCQELQKKIKTFEEGEYIAVTYHHCKGDNFVLDEFYHGFYICFDL